MDGAQVQVVGLEAAELAFHMGEVLVGDDGGGRVELGGGHRGAEHVDAIERGLGGDLVSPPGQGQAGVGDGHVEVLGHLELVDQFAGFEADLVSPGQAPVGHGGHEWGQQGLGGGQQLLAGAGAVGGQNRITAGDQPLAGVVGMGDLGQVLLVEQG